MKKALSIVATLFVAISSLVVVSSIASAQPALRSDTSLDSSSSSSTPSTTPVSSSSSSTTTSSTTTTTIPLEQSQRGWRVISRSDRGVMVDRKTITYDGIAFTALRFRARTTAFHLHGGTIDPPGSATSVPPDAKPMISDGELRVGVVAVFNGGFKADANSGGVILDGKVLETMRPGMATACINNLGQLKIASWGAGLPSKHFAAVSCRQNLPLMVAGAKLTALALNPAWGNWGATLNSIGAQPRSGLGLDAKGNVIYLASMTGSLPSQLAGAEVAAGIVTGMQLDINPEWPSAATFAQAMHQRVAAFSFELPGLIHNPAQYLTSSQRDFFTVVAQPTSWTCSVVTPGLLHGRVTPQPVSLSSPSCQSS